MDKKILTISIAAYNVSQFIDQTLNSLVLKRNMDSLEVLIINDGSKDDTSDKAQVYANEYPNTFRVIDKENGGHGSTINIGLENAHGKYFKVLDGDDWVNTDAVEQLIDKLKLIEVDLVLTDRVNVYTNCNVEIRDFKMFNTGKVYSISEMDSSVNVSLSSICIKTEAMQKSEFKCSEHCFYEDIEYDIYALYVSSTFVYMDLFVYMYRLGQRGQTVSWTSRRKNIHMSHHISNIVNEFYVKQCNNLAVGHKKSIINRISVITYTAFSTYLSFYPTKKIMTQILQLMQEVKSKEVNEFIIKEHVLYRIIYKFPFMYWIIAVLYFNVKKGKD